MARKIVLHTLSAMKKNLTLKLDTGLLRQTRIPASEEDVPISALPADHLEPFDPIQSQDKLC